MYTLMRTQAKTYEAVGAEVTKVSLTPFSENGKKCVKFNTILWLCY
jgi:hypothetical protein